MAWDDPNKRPLVVLNGEDQYCIWPSCKPLPEGWRAEGTGMRPLSLCRALDAAH